MEEENRDLLERRINEVLDELANTEFGSEEREAVIEELTKLYKLKIDETKSLLDYDEKTQIREADERFKQEQMKEQVKDRWIRVGTAAAELMIPLIFYGIWMRRGFKFEETGAYTSTTFRGLFNRFKPTKK